MLKYNIIVESAGEGRIFKWGEEERNWIDTHRDFLDSADRISFIRKDTNEIPITVELDKDKRFVFFSRVFGKINNQTGKEAKVRLYCIGWQSTIKGVNIKSLNWVYPNGMIENAEEPNYVQHYL